MIYPDQLLSVAAQLAEAPVRGAPRQARLRRAISTAYYALFHEILFEAADLLVGANARNSKRYLLVYRSLEHRRIADTCRQILSGTLKDDAGAAFDVALQGCASAFVELQESRHEADYDPTKRIALSDAQTAVAKAGAAMKLLRSAPDGQRALFLTALHFRQRP